MCEYIAAWRSSVSCGLNAAALVTFVIVVTFVVVVVVVVVYTDL